MKTVKILFVLLLAGITLSVSAQKKPIKVGTIDAQELLSLMPEYDSIKVSYERQYREMEAAGNQMYADLQRLQEEYVQRRDSMTPFMASMKKQEIEDLSRRIQLFEQNAQEQLQMILQNLQQPIIDKIKKAIEDVAKENNFTHIVDTSTGVLLYFDEAYDIMGLVKAKLGIKDTVPVPSGN